MKSVVGLEDHIKRMNKSFVEKERINKRNNKLALFYNSFNTDTERNTKENLQLLSLLD